MTRLLLAVGRFLHVIYWILWAATSIAIAVLLMSPSAPFVQHIEPVTYVPREPTWTIYEVSEVVNDCPGLAAILRGIAITESNENPDAIGDGGESEGMFQYQRKYQAERNAKLGWFDPKDPRGSAIAAGQEFVIHLRITGSKVAAISAHNTGLHGTMTNGPNMEYVEKVQRFI